jgi:hypothetical protein
MPRGFSDVAAAEGALLAAEDVSLKFVARGIRLPRARVSRATKLHGGALVLTANRLLVSVGKRSAIDVRYGDRAPDNRALTFRCDESGLHVHVDIAAAVPEGEGTLDIEVRTPIAPDVLASLPRDECVAAMPAQQCAWLAHWA